MIERPEFRPNEVIARMLHAACETNEPYLDARVFRFTARECKSLYDYIRWLEDEAEPEPEPERIETKTVPLADVQVGDTIRLGRDYTVVRIAHGRSTYATVSIPDQHPFVLPFHPDEMVDVLKPEPSTEGA